MKNLFTLFALVGALAACNGLGDYTATDMDADTAATVSVDDTHVQVQDADQQQDQQHEQGGQ